MYLLPFTLRFSQGSYQVSRNTFFPSVWFNETLVLISGNIIDVDLKNNNFCCRQFCDSITANIVCDECDNRVRQRQYKNETKAHW